MHQSRLELKLINWTESHAIVVLSGVFLMVYFEIPVALALTAIFSFSLLILSVNPYWTPIQRFGIANVITSIRLIAISALLIVDNIAYQWIIIVSILVLCLDGLDGWLARKFGIASEFGEYYDKEVDAFYLLALCTLLYTNGQFAIWILIPGLLRYIFVLYLKFSNTSTKKERRNRFGRWIFVLMVSILILGFVAIPPVTGPLTVFMTSLLIYSFFVSV